MLTDDDEANRLVEQEFMHWADAISCPKSSAPCGWRGPSRARSLPCSWPIPKVDSPVKLDLRLIEADQVTTPDLLRQEADLLNAIDGIVFDQHGNPAEYHVLKSHPGDNIARFDARFRPHAGRLDDPLLPRGPAGPEPRHSRDHAGPAAFCPASPLHTGGLGRGGDGGRFRGGALYRCPGQRRGGTESSRWTWWNWNVAWPPCCPADGGLARFKLNNRRPTYGEFKKEILNEIARCLNMPFNVACGNSSGYNYASGRLDHQTYYKSIRVDQDHIGLVVLDRVLRAWLDEAILISELLAAAGCGLPPSVI